MTTSKIRYLLREFILLELKNQDVEQRFLSTKYLTALKKLSLDPNAVKDVVLTTPPQDLSDNSRMLSAAWIISRISDGTITREHILDDLGPDGKISRYLRAFFASSRHIEIKDLNQIKSINQLADLVEPHLGIEKASKVDPRKIADAKRVGGNARFDVYLPETPGAACDLGLGTRWCTSRFSLDDPKDRNMAKSYMDRGPLLVIFDKQTGERYQRHVDKINYNE